MRALLSVAISAVALSAFIPINAPACGESLFRVGKGVHYHAYYAPVPGSVLVYARTEHERAVAKQLQQAGHNVQIVSNDADLAIEMNSHSYDVVIAPYSKREAVEADSERMAARPNWVPVLDGNADDVKSARAHYQYTVSTGDDVRKYLKAIHRSMKGRGT